MASFIYKSFPKAAYDGDFASPLYKIGLLADTHTPDAADTLWSDVSGDEISGTGYTAGGAAVAVTAATDGTKTTFTPTEAQWISATFTARYGVLYETSSGALVLLIDFGSNQSPSGQTFKVNAPSPAPFIS
jgi:hypothetical protein